MCLSLLNYPKEILCQTFHFISFSNPMSRIVIFQTDKKFYDLHKVSKYQCQILRIPIDKRHFHSFGYYRFIRFSSNFLFLYIHSIIILSSNYFRAYDSFHLNVYSIIKNDCTFDSINFFKDVFHMLNALKSLAKEYYYIQLNT